MRRNSLRFVFLLAILFVITHSCKKNKLNNLPPITQHGANNVGFILNDNVWVPYQECSIFQDPCGKISAKVLLPLISFQFARNNKGKNSALTIWTRGTVTSVGNKIDSIRADFVAEDWSGNQGIYSELSTGSKFIITRYDPVAEVISGEFEFILKEPMVNGRTIVLKNGRFDFKFYTCICD